MSSVYKRPGRKIWTAFYRDVHGRQHCRSTGTRNRKLATKIADEFERASRERRTLRQLTKVIDSMHLLVSGETVCRYSTAEYVEQWLAATKLEISPGTYKFYRISSAKFITFLGPRGTVPITSLNKSDLIAYRADLARAVSPTTTNHHLRVVKMICKAACRDGLICDNPAEHL